MRARLSSLAFTLAAFAVTPGVFAGEPRGVVVESVPPRSTGANAGLRAGDLLFSWVRRDEAGVVQAEGVLESPFALRSMEIEQASQGPVELHGERGARPMTWLLRPGAGLQVRPALPKDLLSLYEKGRRAIQAKQVEKGTERWQLAAKRAEAAGNPGTAMWLLVRIGRAWEAKSEWARAEAAYGEAVRLARTATDAIPLVHLLRDWSRSKLVSHDWVGAEAKQREALSTLETRAPNALMERAVCLRALGDILDGTAPAEADVARLAALQIVDSSAPESMEAAAVLGGLAQAALLRSDYRRSSELFERGLAIRRKHQVHDAWFAFSLGQQAWIAMRLGSFDTAEWYAQEALRAAKENEEAYAGALLIMGVVKCERGEFAAADALARQAVQLRRKLGIKESANLVGLLGQIAWRQGDPVRAELHSRHALELIEEDQSTAWALGAALDNLGDAVLRLGRLDEAESLFRRGLQVTSGKAPEAEVVLLESLAILERTRGNLLTAGRHLVDALALQVRSTAMASDRVRLLTQLGLVFLGLGQNETAEERLRQALELARKLMPGSYLEARALNALGRAQLAMGRRSDGGDTLCRAAEALGQQGERVGRGQESRSTFAAEYADYPRECSAARVATGQLEEALRVLEQSRASVLLSMLAEKHLAFSVDLPPETVAERSRIDSEYDRAQAELGALKAERIGTEGDRLQAHLQELRDRRADLAARVRNSSSRLASLQYPEPLDLYGVRGALDPGTLFVAYSTGAKETLLFAVEPIGSDGPGFSVHSLPIERAALAGKIEELRSAISRASARGTSGPPPAARELYRTLLGPVDAAIGRHQRLLISPDGPLHVLPFAALWGGSPEGYLVERVPIHVVASATVYAELKKSRRPTAPSDFRVVAFGDPEYPRLPKAEADELRNHELRAAVVRGDVFPPLPTTRAEVRSIAALFPGRATTYVGNRATEEKVKAIGKDARYLHFACHGVLNERFPLDSALALSLRKDPRPGEDNGLLQAWEVFDSVRLDAELVTLSACQSGLGKEMGGEGLLGLTRAFQYAGARSVLASLWSVSDDSTAELMKRFYGHLKDGSTKDEALRAAQREMIQAGAEPFHWAAFQLSGDWK